MASNKPPVKNVFPGLPVSMPSGYILGRISAGNGPVELINQGSAKSAGLVPVTLPPSGKAGGDLSGTYPNPTVARIQGVPVTITSIANGNVLSYNGTAFVNSVPHYVIAGGTTGQVLTKNSNTDYDLLWSSPSSGGGAASAQDDGTNFYVAISDTDGQLVLDGSGDPIFEIEVFPISALPAAGGYISGTLSSATVNKVKGVTDGSNAAAGDVGEVISALLPSGSAVTLTSAAGVDVVSMTLTPGDWDVIGTVALVNPGGAGVSFFDGWINNASNTFPGFPNNGGCFNYPNATSNLVGNTGAMRWNVTVNTTIYLSCNTLYSTGTATVYGFMRARRVR